MPLTMFPHFISPLTNGHSFSVSLNDEVIGHGENIYYFEGLKPGKYLLKIKQSSLIVSGNEFQQTDYEGDIVYQNYIYIPPKKIIWAYVNQEHQLKICKQKSTYTVSLPVKETFDLIKEKCYQVKQRDLYNLTPYYKVSAYVFSFKRKQKSV